MRKAEKGFARTPAGRPGKVAASGVQVPQERPNSLT